jgi:hypothetical protein
LDFSKANNIDQTQANDVVPANLLANNGQNSNSSSISSNLNQATSSGENQNTQLNKNSMTNNDESNPFEVTETKDYLKSQENEIKELIMNVNRFIIC